MDSIVLFLVLISVGLPDTAEADLSIMAPEIICPKGGNDTFSRPENSIIRILSETHTDMTISWSVSWSPLAVVSQRLTVMAWKSVRDLDKKLNGPQAEPLLSIIKNDELITGVNYILNLTANVSDEIITKSFSIKYIKNNQDSSAILSTSDTFSIILLGGRSTYPDLDFIIEAHVTTCSTTQDYYFTWNVYSKTSNHILNVSKIIGSRLEMPRFTLKPGAYEVNCQLRNESDGVLIKEVKALIHVYSGGSDVFLNVDFLIVSKDSAFTIESLVVNHDYEDYTSEYKWECYNKGEPCDFVDNSNNSSLYFSSGIPSTGEYLITLTVVVLNQSASANATVVVVAPSLPIVQIEPVSRVINQGTRVTLLGKATRVAPSCSLTWYGPGPWTAEGFLNSSELHGVAISETYTVFSLEENFLSELTDFSNDTKSAAIEADITSPGGARFIAECNCTSSSNCESIDVTVTYAEVHLHLNGRPELEDLVVTPETGSALETVFQIRSRAKDLDRPLLYSFYCAIGPNVTLLLGSYLEYETVETFLPFIDGETLIWVEVCDALGACSKSKTCIIQVRPSSGNTFYLLIEYARSFIRRCEIIRLLHVAISGLISYTNAGQLELASLFTRTLLESLPGLYSGCSLPHERYAGILGQLTAAGFDVTPLLASFQITPLQN